MVEVPFCLLDLCLGGCREGTRSGQTTRAIDRYGGAAQTSIDPGGAAGGAVERARAGPCLEPAARDRRRPARHALLIRPATARRRTAAAGQPSGEFPAPLPPPLPLTGSWGGSGLLCCMPLRRRRRRGRGAATRRRRRADRRWHRASCDVTWPWPAASCGAVRSSGAGRSGRYGPAARQGRGREGQLPTAGGLP